MIPVPHPGNEQQSQWLQIRQAKPDWVILLGLGRDEPDGAEDRAAKIGFPRDKIVGVWWAGRGRHHSRRVRRQGLLRRRLQPRRQLPGVKEIQNNVYKKGKGNMEDKRASAPSVQPRRGARRSSPSRRSARRRRSTARASPMTGEQVRWGIENLNIDAGRLKTLGAEGFMPPMKVSCQDHEGSGQVKFQQWDRQEWKVITDWMRPTRRWCAR
jgi:branched-chain amino acid transport system substrate-binding protein